MVPRQSYHAIEENRSFWSLSIAFLILIIRLKQAAMSYQSQYFTCLKYRQRTMRIVNTCTTPEFVYGFLQLCFLLRHLPLLFYLPLCLKTKKTPTLRWRRMIEQNKCLPRQREVDDVWRHSRTRQKNETGLNHVLKHSMMIPLTILMDPVNGPLIKRIYKPRPLLIGA